MNTSKNNYKKALIILLFFSNIFSLVAQEAKVVSAESKLTVDGTSNLHDWTIDAKKMYGKANLVIDANTLKEIKSLDFSVDVDQLKSTHDGMDANTIKALNGKVHKSIVFKLTKVIKITKVSDGNFSVETQGNLTVAGATKLINQSFTIKVAGEKVVFSGKQKIDMTVYGVKPPKALLGTIRTGKDVVVNFKVTYN
ncbi:MAG: YceI family protein [Flavobacterium sp.]|uniref:YceI family protein n=1 Tax=Flavobacterium sp. TaxID=239 RepID=UPI0022C9B97B|nr:YceI family protein [Flavobacterium sp.]MCZ8196198.1 YceI family protein [Flavobacterium sp.]